MLLGLCLCQGPTSIFQWWWGNVVIATTENRKEKRENLSCLKQKSDLRGDAFGEWPSFHGGLELHVLNLLLEHILIHLC